MSHIRRTDAAIARLSATICMAMRVNKSNGKPFGFDDFMVYQDEPEATPDDMKRMFGVQK